MLEFYQNGNLSSSASILQTTATLTTTTLSHHHRDDHENTIQTEIIGYNVRDIASHIKCEKTYAKCNGCDKKIRDRFIMRMNDIHHMRNGTWHENCLSCSICGISLSERCYTRNNKLYCLSDYKERFGARCTRCKDFIEKNEKVMIVNNYKFHLHCFTCETCFQPLQKGEQFVMRCGQLFCRRDFENNLYMPQCHDDSLLDDAIRPRDGRRGPKRPRTILTSAQRRQFKSSFEMSPKPCRKVREALAKDTGLSVRVVQVWFQNQRAKMKKIQRKSKQDGDKGIDKDGIKEEKGIKQESPSSEHSHYLLSNSFEQPLNPNNPYLSDDYNQHSNDSLSDSEMSVDDCFDNCDDGTSDTLSLQNVDIQTSGSLRHNHNNSICSLISAANPIDKLYSMQAHYFLTEQ